MVTFGPGTGNAVLNVASPFASVVTFVLPIYVCAESVRRCDSENSWIVNCVFGVELRLPLIVAELLTILTD